MCACCEMFGVCFEVVYYFVSVGAILEGERAFGSNSAGEFSARGGNLVEHHGLIHVNTLRRLRPRVH